MENIKIENVLHPKEVLNDYKDILLSRYIDEYGSKYIPLIKSRINKTTYIFESTPEETIEFLKKSKVNTHNYLFELKTQVEYDNYIKVKSKIDKRLIESFKNYFQLSTQSFNTTYLDEIIDLDFASYDYNTTKALNDLNTSERIKKEIIDRRKRYKEKCIELGVPIITSWEKATSLENTKNILLKREHELLLKNTIWGKRVLKEFFKGTKRLFSLSWIAESVFNTNPGHTRIFHSYKKNIVLCVIPLMRESLKDANLDTIFLHENRHVIETGLENCGICRISNDEYDLLNEIHTQKNAIKDTQEFKKIPIFMQKEIEYSTSYDHLFPYTGNIFDNYYALINEFAITGKINELEELLGKKNIKELEKYLNDVYKSMRSTYEEEIQPNNIREKRLIYKIENRLSG